MSVQRELVRTARQEHTCSECDGVIAKGDRYHAITWHDDGWHYAKFCRPCDELDGLRYAYAGCDCSEQSLAEAVADWLADDEPELCAAFVQRGVDGRAHRAGRSKQYPDTR